MAQLDAPLGRVAKRSSCAARGRVPSFLWNVKPSGAVFSALLMSRRRSSGTPVCVLPAMPAGTGSGIGATKSRSGLSDAKVSSSTVKRFFTCASTASGVSVALLHQGLREQLAHRRVGVDLLVHDRLGERRLVALVVSVAPIANQVDQEVAPEADPVTQARRAASRQATGSSALTCTMGILKPRASPLA